MPTTRASSASSGGTVSAAAGDQPRALALLATGIREQRRPHLGKAAAVHRLVQLGQFTTYRCGTLRAEYADGLGQRVGQPVRRLVEHQRLAPARQFPQPGDAGRGSRRQEAFEEEPVGGQAGDGQGRDRGAGARHRADRDIGGPQRGQQADSRGH